MNSSSNLRWIRSAVLAGLIAPLMHGCYLLDSARGQLALMSKREPIKAVLANPSTPPRLRKQLEEVTSIRDFASRELLLPDNGSYRRYADVGRPYVVWNVVAAPEFSVDARQWCYPIVGCVAYRGYFSERKARAFAEDLHSRGFDVSVGGVAAYSTLGHFDDPILNTMVGWSDIEFAAIIFHELTHQLLYVPGDASFNEALATTIEEEGVRRWLLAQGREADLARHLREQARYREAVDSLRATRDKLKTLYASGIDRDEMRRRKQAVFDGAREAFASFDRQWAGAPNNAHLASIATYYDCVPGFQRELESVHGDLGAFYRRVRELAALDQAARDATVCARP